jgi:pimeloyl-ACP methyl ester carboxylesterase
MHKLTSKDGTSIAFDRLGGGPPVILVCGGSVDRMSNAPLAERLAQHFTVLNYDRRGRGDSGDSPPYAVEREIEDIQALAEAAGGTAFLYGASSGAALALEAAHALPGTIAKLALWEPPYIPAGFPRPPADTAKVFTDLVAQGRRGDAAEFFMAKVVGLPPEFVEQARSSPWWPAQEAIAHTLGEAAVRGLPDDDLGERIEAWVVLREGQTASPDALTDHVASLIAWHKRPRRVHVVAALPRNAMGKVIKAQLTP